MITGFCRQCKREFHEDLDYYGYCNISCCADFAFEQRITYCEARDLCFNDREEEDLKDKIAELECSYNSAYGEASCLNDDLDNACQENRDLKKKVRELESLDWEKIKAERRGEATYNDSVFRRMNNMKTLSDDVQEKMRKVQRDNLLLKDQNLDLLDSIKKMNSHSERFQQLDLGIELDYDE